MNSKIGKVFSASAFCLATVIGASLAMSANTPLSACSKPSNCSDLKPALKKILQLQLLSVPTTMLLLKRK